MAVLAVRRHPYVTPSDCCAIDPERDEVLQIENNIYNRLVKRSDRTVTDGRPRGAGCALLGRMDRRWSTPQLGLALAVPTLLVLVMVASALSGPRVTQIPMPERQVSPPPATATQGGQTPLLPTMSPGAEGGLDGPAWLGLVLQIIAGVAIALVLVFVGLLIWRYAPRLRLRVRGQESSDAKVASEAPQQVSEQAVRSAVEAGIGELDDESSDPRRAVIACWLRLEAAAASAGVERQPQDAPADLVTRLLERYDVSRPLLLGLADLYRRARYAPADVDPAMRTRARETLLQLRAELSGRSSTSAGAS